MKNKFILLLAVVLLSAGRMTAQNFNAWPVTQIVAGGGHTLFIKSDGTMWGMGDNSYGQLGLGAAIMNVNVPRQLTNGVSSIAAGEYHSLFVSGKNLWAMGDNAYGQLGDTTTNNQLVPEKIFSVTGNNRFGPIAGGGYHSLFVTTSLGGGGGLWTMGQNLYGQLGDGSDTDHHMPEEILTFGTVGNPAVTAIAGGLAHSLFVKADGSLWAMGYNGDGEVGDATFSDTNKPAMIEASNVVAVAAGGYHSIIMGNLDVGRYPQAMGFNHFGQLGVGDNLYERENFPYEVLGLYPALYGGSSVTAVAAGGEFSLFVLSDGSLWAVGWDEVGQLGNGAAGEDLWTDIPELIVASNVVAVAARENFSLFIKSDGSLWGMGDNRYGQLGTGDYTQRHVPVEIVAPPPQISLLPYGANVILAWSSNALGFHLQATTNLTPPVVWNTNTPSPVLIGNQFEVFTPGTGAKMFYRLSQ